MNDLIICTQSIKKGRFTNEPGSTTYLSVPANANTFLPEHKISLSEFVKTLVNEKQEDIVVFIHGYNTEDDLVLTRHRTLKEGLRKKGFTGDVVTFAWPSGKNPLLYLEDRHDAKKTAMELVNSCIRLLVHQQNKDCTINVHLIAHSTGAYIVKEAFDDSETTRQTAESNWVVSQILFVSGDISSDAMSGQRGESVYRHCNRLTNYFNPHDTALAISNVKRVGAKNRVGRVGLPDESPGKAIDVNCGSYYANEATNLTVEGLHSHSWYFYSDVWLEDACHTLQGKLDREVIPTREADRYQELHLKG